MPTYDEPTKNNVTYNEPSSTEGWLKGWFNKPWFGGGKKDPSYTEPSKESPSYTEPNKGE